MPGPLRDVLPGAAALLGVTDDRLDLAARLGRAERVVVVLVDGLGHHLLRLLGPEAPLLGAAAAGGADVADELRCGFPSTTPTSLVSVGTGAQPGEHGIVGFTVRRPDTGALLTHIEWGDDPDPDVWQPLPTWFERLGAAGRPAHAVLPAAFVGSGLTNAAYRGATFHPVAPKADYAEQLVAVVRDDAAAGGLVYGYTALLDTAAHVHGVGSPPWHEAARIVDALLARVLEALPAGAVLLVTADHGALDVAPDARVDVDVDPRLRAGVEVVAGEPRVRYLHTRPGAREDVVAAWSAVLGPAAQVLTRDDVITRGLLGPVPDAHRARIGDVVVICLEPVAVLATRTEPPAVARLVGFHGGLRPEETAVPLLAWHGPHG